MRKGRKHLMGCPILSQAVGATSLCKISADKFQKLLILFIRSRGYPEISGFAVDFAYFLEIYFFIKSSFKNFFGTLTRHGAIDEHVVTVGRIWFEAQLLKFFGKNSHPLVIMFDFVFDLIRIVDDGFSSCSRHDTHIPGQKHAIEGGNHLLAAQHEPESDTGKTVCLGKRH